MTLTLNTGWNRANAKRLALLAQDAYTKPPTLVCPEDGTAVIISEVDGVDAMDGEDRKAIVVAFEGTHNPRQFITDVQAWKHNIGKSSVHAGFYQTMASGLRQINETLNAINGDKQKTIIVTGHSLGGALAQMCAFELQVLGFSIDSVYTFGSPRVANAVGVLDYGRLSERTWRVVNGADIVPWCPGWSYGYRHTRCEMYMPATGGVIGHPALIFKSLGNALEIWREWQRGGAAFLTDHFLDSYIARLDKIQ